MINPSLLKRNPKRSWVLTLKSRMEREYFSKVLLVKQNSSCFFSFSHRFLLLLRKLFRNKTNSP